MTVKQETQYQYLNRIAKENRYTINSLSREAGLSNSTIFYLKRRPLKKINLETNLISVATN